MDIFGDIQVRYKNHCKFLEQGSAIISQLPVNEKEPEYYKFAVSNTKKHRQSWDTGAKKLFTLMESAPENSAYILNVWSSDAFLGGGQLEKALESYPRAKLGMRNSAQSDRLLSLKLHLGHNPTGIDIASLFGPRLTKFGRENIDFIVQYLDAQLTALREEGRIILNEWLPDSYKIPTNGFTLFNGYAGHIASDKLQEYSFSLSKTADEMCHNLLREAENTFREEVDIPRIGEGWISETKLYYEIKNSFPTIDVIQHSRPDWLGRQHLDIFIPEFRVAIEFQGEQHDKPIAFFGGVEAYQRTLKRDKRKLALCQKNSVHLIYVRAGYNLSEVIGEIIQSSQRI